MAEQEVLAIDLSKECLNAHPRGKPWLDFRSFAQAFWQLLAAYKLLLVSYDTERILREVAANIKKSTGIEPNFKTEVLGTSRTTRSAIANWSKHNIDRVLWFLDPENLLEQLQSVPLRMMSERGHKLHVNFGAAVWADRAQRLLAGDIQQHVEVHPGDAIAMVEEHAIVPIAELIAEHFRALKSFSHIMATTKIRNIIKSVFKATASSETKGADAKCRLTVFRDSPYGELIGIGHQIVQDYYNVPPLLMQPRRRALCHVVAFARYQEEPGIEMQKFFEIAADPRLRVNLLLNEQTANDWIGRFEPPKYTFIAGAES
jgi:hypothetical protein